MLSSAIIPYAAGDLRAFLDENRGRLKLRDTKA